MPAPAPLAAKMADAMREAGATADDLRVLALIPDDDRRALALAFFVHLRSGGLDSLFPLLESLVEKMIENGKPQTVGGITLCGWARGEFGIQIGNGLGAFYVVLLLIKRPDLRERLEFKEGVAGLLFRHGWKPFAESADDAR